MWDFIATGSYDEARAKFPEFAEHNGHKTETYYIKTEDGYYLTTYRIAAKDAGFNEGKVVYC